MRKTEAAEARGKALGGFVGAVRRQRMARCREAVKLGIVSLRGILEVAGRPRPCVRKWGGVARRGGTASQSGRAVDGVGGAWVLPGKTRQPRGRVTDDEWRAGCERATS